MFPHWITDIKKGDLVSPDIPIVVVGNKTDLPAKDRTVEYDDLFHHTLKTTGLDFDKDYMEISVLEGRGLRSCLLHLSRKITGDKELMDKADYDRALKSPPPMPKPPKSCSWSPESKGAKSNPPKFQHALQSVPADEGSNESEEESDEDNDVVAELFARLGVVWDSSDEDE